MPAISASRTSEGADHPQPANLVRETQQRLDLSQAKFAAKLGVSFQSINPWENGRTKLLSIALRQIEHLLHQMGEAGQDLLVKYVSE